MSWTSAIKLRTSGTQRGPPRSRSSAMPPWRRVLAYLVLGVWALGCLGPLYWLAVNSLELPIDAAAGPRYLPFVDFEPTLHGWRLLAETFSAEIVGPYLTTIELSLAVTVLTLLIALPCAYALCRWRYTLPATTLAA